ncbi:MAG: hypothetical protein FJZ87_01520 [Chloroflexi bacterium]|nr:hypothetical protein [Chloroflexota bacterium]
MRKNLLFLFTLLLSACSTIGSGTYESPDSGIDVQVLIGPMCPVVQFGTECPDGPYQALLTVIDSRGREVMQFETDEGGRYRAYLAPGDYVLRPETPKGMPLPFAEEQRFTVEPLKFTQVVIHYDSGIR